MKVFFATAKTARSTSTERIRAGFHAGDERGLSLVELALVLPVLMLILTGILTFGLVLNNYLILTNATNTGAQLMAISRGQTADPCATAVTAIKNAAPYLNPVNLSISFVLNGVAYGTSCTGAVPTNFAQGQSAQVTATYTACTPVIYGGITAPCTLKAQTTELVQ